MRHPFRFGYQLSGADDIADPVGAAIDAEQAGFDVVLVSDHVGPGNSPMVVLGAIAQATERIRLGTFVLNHDMRNPVQLAWETATLDRISGGRFELGLGAGHTPHEYAATGIAFDAPAVRKERLMEGVEVLRRLFDGETVTFRGEHLAIDGASIQPVRQDRLPILIGGNGEKLLTHAGANADIIGLQGLGRTQPDGHRHAVKWNPEWLDIQVDQVRSGAGTRFADLELNALVQVTDITDDAARAVASLCEAIPDLEAAQVDAIPYALIGTVDEIVAKIHECRDRWGVTYFVVRDREAFREVIGRINNA